MCRGLCIQVHLCVCGHEVYALTSQTSSQKGCRLLTHPLYISPKMFARFIESYTESAISFISIHTIVPGGLSGIDLSKQYDKKAMPSLEIVKSTVWLNRNTGKANSM